MLVRGMGFSWSGALNTVENVAAAPFVIPLQVGGKILTGGLQAAAPVVSAATPVLTQASSAVGSALQNIRPQAVPVPEAAATGSRLPIYLGIAAAGIVALLLLTRKKPHQEAHA